MASLWNNNSDVGRFGVAGGLGGIGAGIAGLLGGYNNPGNEANKYLSKIPNELDKYFSPYIQAGQRQLPGLENQYGKLTSDPGGTLNQMGQGFQQSPGFQFALQQALQGAGHAQAAGGMAGSPQHEFENMNIATQMGNQEYYDWLNQVTGLYGKGLEGQQGLFNTGAKAGMGLGEDIGNVLGQQGQYSYAGTQGENLANSQSWGNLLGGAGMLAAFL